jgi:hypothetical protein
VSRTTRACRSVAERVRAAQVRVTAAAVVAASIVYGWLVPSTADPTGWERVVASWVHVGGRSRVATLASAVITAGSPVAVGAIAVGVSAGLLASGRTRAAAAAFVSVLSGSAGAEVAKHLVGRHIGAHGALGYPSGHTAGATAAVMTMVLVMAPGAVPVALRRLATALPVIVGGAVGLAMASRGSHYGADVIGGLAFGTCVPLALLGWPVAVPAADEPADDGELPLDIPTRPPVTASRRFGLRGEPTEPATPELAADTR